MLDAAALQLLSAHPWPGNLTQLQQVLERAALLSANVTITSELLDTLLRESDSSLEALRSEGSLRERESLLTALRTAKGNVSRTAELLGLSRQAVYRLLDKFEISTCR